MQDIVEMHEALGLTPDEIVSQITGLSLGEVSAALNYYHDHLDEIRAHMRQDDQLAAQVQIMKVSKLAQKLIGQ